MDTEIRKGKNGYKLIIRNEKYVVEAAFEKADESTVRAFEKSFLSFKNDGRLTSVLIDKKLKISAMESCTGGLFASNITDYEGASAIFRGSFVTYSNEAKIAAGVPEMIITEFGVYSPETAYSMARAARRNTGSGIAAGITGSYANPDPENADSVTGEIYAAAESENGGFTAKITLLSLEKTRRELKQLTVDIISGLIFSFIA
ncbi:MAG: CinA family protein [Clostridia bacterium]|nr:CinA family protein [Clostridia bacterium]